MLDRQYDPKNNSPYKMPTSCEECILYSPEIALAHPEIILSCEEWKGYVPQCSSPREGAMCPIIDEMCLNWSFEAQPTPRQL